MSIKKLFILSVLIAFYSCNDAAQQSGTTTNTQNEITSKETTDSSKNIIEVAITHKLNLQCGADHLPVRKRILSSSELTLSNSGSKEAQSLNENVILSKIYNDCLIELIYEEGDYYKIKFEHLNKIIEGYIVKKYCGKNTILPLSGTNEKMSTPNIILNPELLPYCRVFVSKKFHDLLIKGKKSENPLKYLKQILSDTQTELLLFSLFVGQSSRILYQNEARRSSSDFSQLIYYIKNDYYIYSFLNYPSSFAVITPSIPVRVKSHQITNYTLNLATDAYNNYIPPQKVKLHPKDNRNAFVGRKGAVWILNDSIEMVDISYISDRISIPETQIENTFFNDVFELYIQDILPKRQDTYLEHYLE